jgi:DNA-binding response OmpR family regulator
MVKHIDGMVSEQQEKSEENAEKKRVKRILVVEDEQEVLGAIAAALIQEGFAVVGAQNGEEAIKSIDENAPDLLIVDLFLPERDGFDVLAHSVKKNAQRPVVAMTGGGAHKLEKKTFLDTAILAGASATLEKPFGKAELLRIVQQLLSF